MGTRRSLTGVDVDIESDGRASFDKRLEELTTAPVAKVDVAGVKAVAAPGTSVALVASETMVRAFWIQAKKAGGANGGTVYLKQGTASADLRADHFLALDPGDYWEKPIPAGTKYDLANLYLDADIAADGVVFGYVPV